MKNGTDEFSFILKPSTVCDGVGVFSTHAIKEGTRLRLFGNQNEEDSVDRARHLDKSAVPEILRGNCVDREDYLLCPDDFGHMQIGWYINHSSTSNTRHVNTKWFYAARDIAEGEEILIDYNSLGEPEESKEGYYNN